MGNKVGDLKQVCVEIKEQIDWGNCGSVKKHRIRSIKILLSIT